MAAVESTARSAALPRNGILRNISYLIGGQMTTWMLAAVWTVVVPRQIGPTGMGELVTVWSATGILAVIVSLGTRILVVTDIARNPASAGRTVSAVLVARLSLFILGLGLMAAYLHFTRFSHYEVLLLVVATITMPLTLMSEVLIGAFQGLERMQYLAYLEVIPKTFSTAGGVVLTLLGFRVLGLVILGASASALALGMGVYWARRHFDLVWRVDAAEVGRVVVKSFPFWATSIISTVYLWVDSVLLALIASPAEVGWYGVPTKLFATVLFVPSIIATATLARLTATHADGNESFKRTLTPIVESTLLLSLPIAAGAAAVAGPAVTLLYGAEFSASGPVLVILALAIPATYLNIVVNQSLVASNRQILWTKVMAVSLVLNVIFNVAAIPAAHRWWNDGALGAALSLLATELMMAAVGLYLVRSSLDSTALGRLARAALAALAMGLVVHAAAPLGLALQVALGVLMFGGVAVPLRLVREHELAMGRVHAKRWVARLAALRAS